MLRDFAMRRTSGCLEIVGSRGLMHRANKRAGAKSTMRDRKINEKSG